jgi:hypothetical protein
MSRFKTSHLFLFLMLGLIAPVYSFAEAHYCIAVNNGFGHGGTTFIGLGFSLPAEGNCTPWSGFTKTASSVVLTTTGTGCLSSDGKVLTVSAINSDPPFFGADELRSDYIQLKRSSTSQPIGSGEDTGAFGGIAKPITCTTSLLNLPSSHD